MARARIPALLLLLAAMSTGAGAVSPTSAAPANRPNIVVLMTDDQTVESMRVMANVQRLLVDRGATFENSFVSYSLCCPSRATFLTGQYAHNHGVLSNTPPAGGYQALKGGNTLPVWLQRAGYATIHLGKYLNGYGLHDPTQIPPGWTEWHGAVDPSSYAYYDYTLNENGTLVTYGHDAADYKTDVYASKAVDIIRRRAAAGAPFFLWVAFPAPHSGGPSGPNRPADSAVPAPRHAGRFAAQPLPRPPSFDEDDVTDKPAHIRSLPRLSADKIAELTAQYRLQLESLLAVDDAVGRIVAALERSGELDKTLIVFTTDNGFMNGEHRMAGGKIVPYEPSLRVPLVMRGPGIPAGLRLRQQVANVDLAPTIARAAGAQPGLTMDGRSLWPLFADPGIFWGRDLLHEGEWRDPPLSFVALRTPRWVYVKYSSGEEELYDLAGDPHELHSLHASPALASLRAELARRLAALATCKGDSCREEPALVASVRVLRACRGAIELTGPDRNAVRRVVFQVDGSPVATDRSAPFRLVRRLGPRGSTVRVHAVLADGREVTEDRKLPGCRY